MSEEKPDGITPITEEKKEPIIIQPPQSDGKQAFCVALPVSGGRPLKMTGDNPHDFISFLKDSSVAWINFPVKDIKKDADLIAMSLGFSSSLVPTVLSSYLSAYEDRDTEIGLMLPAVMGVSTGALLVASRRSETEDGKSTLKRSLFDGLSGK